ncbi:MAG: hypothetical protein K1X92_17870 [Bacteroidia bacterium]|nr:hypothetical protein [Bacteroidia bacterium]
MKRINYLFFIPVLFSLMFCSISGIYAFPGDVVLPVSNMTTKEIGTNPVNKEFGLLRSVEDSGYPLVTLTIEFPERHFTEVFGLNLEEVRGVSAEMLQNAVGQYVSFEYNSETTNDLIDLVMEERSLIPQGHVIPDGAELLTVVGTLSNAAEVTQSDLPDVLYVQTIEEITVPFEYYITPEIVQANGQQVIAMYMQRTRNTITSLRVSK